MVKDGEKNVREIENEQENKTGENANNVVKGDQGGSVTVVDSTKSGKKKIVRRIIKQKIPKKKKDSMEEAVNKEEILPDQNDVGKKILDPNIACEKDESSANASAVKTFKRKKIVKVVSGENTPREDSSAAPQVKPVDEGESAENKAKCLPEGSSTAVVQDARVKTTVKKKIVRRVPKRKVTAADAKDGAPDAGSRKDDLKDETLDNTSLQISGPQNSGHTSHLSDGKLENNGSQQKESASQAPKKEDKLVEKKDHDTLSKTEPKTDEQKVSGNDSQAQPKEREHLKDDKQQKDGNGNDDSKYMKNKGLKEKQRSEEPPRRPGLILQTKGSRDSKVCPNSAS